MPCVRVYARQSVALATGVDFIAALRAMIRVSRSRRVRSNPQVRQTVALPRSPSYPQDMDGMHCPRIHADNIVRGEACNEHEIRITRMKTTSPDGMHTHERALLALEQFPLSAAYRIAIGYAILPSLALVSGDHDFGWSVDSVVRWGVAGASAGPGGASEIAALLTEAVRGVGGEPRAGQALRFVPMAEVVLDRDRNGGIRCTKR